MNFPKPMGAKPTKIELINDFLEYIEEKDFYSIETFVNESYETIENMFDKIKSYKQKYCPEKGQINNQKL